MAQSTSPISGVAERYAGSLFELAREQGGIAEVEATLTRFEGLLAGSEDLKRLVQSPVFSAEEQAKAVAAVCQQMGIGGLAGNFLKVVAQNRRLFAVPEMIKSFRQIAAQSRGEVAAEVASAHALTGEQEQELRATLRQIAGKDVAVSVTVDPSLLGGLVVRMGSRQIDTSLKTKLNSLKFALKEVG